VQAKTVAGLGGHLFPQGRQASSRVGVRQLHPTPADLDVWI